MKIALYIEDGLEQIVLTPEGEAEQNLLARLQDDTRDITIRRGGFYACMGGWVRHREAPESTMIVMRRKVAA
ncbi:MAG TPA: hypothetical protein VGN74_05460 [Brevundimonas sp.]|jgi:hypothetical protein|uniref:hypothetical protein n=1 Tax=Brevundimonas sp. TaxID=1871086 RepID=UPI002E14CCD4|nr:hypothetical protein [Brevundimonas sp.]